MPFLQQQPDRNAEPEDAWSLEAEAEHELFQAQQIRRAMQSEVWAGAGLLGCIASVVAVIGGRPCRMSLLDTVGEGLLLWATVIAARRWSARKSRS